jgi:hypothetical protein
MGKSSLRVQTMHRLQSEGVGCAAIDMTLIGTQQITPEQWYATLVAFLAYKFQIKQNIRNWWRERQELSLVSRLSEFIETVLLQEISQPIVIFIDEVDSVLSLKFPIDDFFALIRAWYNKRSENSAYNRLTFTLLGVTTPADLISDKNRTPFNIGKAIDLKGFDLSEASPLLPGLAGVVSQPKAILQQILYWSGGQPFLTQKLCHLVVSSYQLQDKDFGNILLGNEAFWLSQLVNKYIIDNWESQDEPEHLRTIRDRFAAALRAAGITRNEQRVGRLLGLYQQVLSASQGGQGRQGGTREGGQILSLPHHVPPSGVPVDDSSEQIELLLSGLVVKHEGFLQVRNPIYQAVFNLDWVNKQLEKLRPYSAALQAWLASECQDNSRLLRGQALQDALSWAGSRSLSSQDYQFLAASQELDRQQVLLTLEA